MKLFSPSLLPPPNHFCFHLSGPETERCPWFSSLGRNCCVWPKCEDSSWCSVWSLELHTKGLQDYRYLNNRKAKILRQSNQSDGILPFCALFSHSGCCGDTEKHLSFLRCDCCDLHSVLAASKPWGAAHSQPSSFGISSPREAQAVLELWGQTQAAAATAAAGTRVLWVCVGVWLEGFPPGNSGINDTLNPLCLMCIQGSALKRKKRKAGREKKIWNWQAVWWLFLQSLGLQKLACKQVQMQG